jgi:hypothetical protein
MTLTRAFVAQIKGLRHASHAESNFQTLWNLAFRSAVLEGPCWLLR